MVKRGFIWIAAGAVLSGCAGIVPRDALADRRQPQVSVTAGHLAVSPNPLVFSNREGPVNITWHAPKGYTFPANGIVFDGELLSEGTKTSTRPMPAGEVDCKNVGGQTVFVCHFKNSRDGRYKYTIRATNGDQTLVLDPELIGTTKPPQ